MSWHVKRPQDSFYSCQILAACWDLAAIIKKSGGYCHRDEPARRDERHSHYKTFCRKAAVRKTSHAEGHTTSNNRKSTEITAVKVP